MFSLKKKKKRLRLDVLTAIQRTTFLPVDTPHLSYVPRAVRDSGHRAPRHSLTLCPQPTRSCVQQGSMFTLHEYWCHRPSHGFKSAFQLGRRRIGLILRYLHMYFILFCWFSLMCLPRPSHIVLLCKCLVISLAFLTFMSLLPPSASPSLICGVSFTNTLYL